MVQEIITWCSVHYAKDEQVKASSFEPILLPGWRAPRFVDLCDTCEKELIEPLRNVVDEYGDKLDRTPPPVNVLRENRRGKAPQAPPTRSGPGKVSAKEVYAEGVSCPLVSKCRQNDRLFRSRATLRDHMRASHDRELAEVEAEIGTSAEGFEVKFFCDYEDCSNGYASAQGLSNHIRIEH